MRTAACVLLAGLAGCRVGPDRILAAPLVMPDAFAASADSNGTPPDEWWRTFGDSVLVKLVERALAANHDVVAAAARVTQARAMAGQAEAGNLPNLSLGVDRQWLYASRQAAGLAGAGVRSGLVQRQQDLHRVGINASWELDLFGAVARRVEAADAGTDVALASLRGMELLVAAEVASSYLDMLSWEQRLELANARVASLHASVDLAMALHAAGLGDDGAVRAAQVQWRAELARPALLSAELKAITYRLAVLLGEAPEHFLVPSHDTEFELPRQLGLGVPAELLRRRPDLMQAEAEVAIATAQVGIATADLYPRVFLLGSVGFESQSFDRLLRSSALQAMGGPSLQLPLFQGGALRQALVAAEARERAALASFVQRVLVALADVEAAAQRHAASREQMAAAELALGDATQLTDLTEQLLATGLADRGRLLRVERDRLAAAERLLVAKNAAAQAAVASFKALGGGLAMQR